MRVVNGVASMLAALAIAGTYALTMAPPVVAAAPAPSPDSIFVVSVGGEGLDAAIKRQADVDPAYRHKALMLTRAWQAQLAAGNQIVLQSITKDQTSQQISETLARLEASLQFRCDLDFRRLPQRLPPQTRTHWRHSLIRPR